ncbi:MAG: uroporphyrinogen-III C-methyltransferase [bacterium]
MQKGKVYLVGAGPGDPELITLRGLRLVQEADAVVHDRLIHPKILEQIRPGAERFYVGKECDHHTVPQEKINSLLVQKAREGKAVVRLKGGDPFVFGRGAEEVLYLVEQGVPWEVVPGVTSATAVPAYAGIPITHREFSSMASIITGHETSKQELSRLPYHLIGPNDSTLVILMGMTNLQTITQELMAHGRPPSTPACVITRGTYPEQQVLAGTLSDIAARKEEAGLEPPGIIVIGEVVRLRDKLQLPHDRSGAGPRRAGEPDDA